MLSGREAIRAGTHYSQGGDCQKPNKGHHRTKKLLLPQIVKSIFILLPADPGLRFITDAAGWELGLFGRKLRKLCKLRKFLRAKTLCCWRVIRRIAVPRLAGP